MSKNLRFLSGILPGSREYSYNLEKFTQENMLYIEFTGHQFVCSDYLADRPAYLNYQLMYVVAGRIVYENSGISGDARSGQAILMRTGTKHMYTSDGKSETMWIHFNGVHFQPLFERMISQNNNSLTFDMTGNKDFVSKLNDLIEGYKEASPPPDMIATAKLTELLGIMASSHNNASSDAVHSAVFYIRSHYNEPISLNDLAEQNCLSVSRFSAVFRNRTGYSPYQYIINTRLNTSSILLTCTTSSINEIAEQVGFADSSAFIMAFKKRYSCTPLQYRKKFTLSPTARSSEP